MRKGPYQLWASSARCGGRKWRERRAGRRGNNDVRGGPSNGGALLADHGGRGPMRGGREDSTERAAMMVRAVPMVVEHCLAYQR